MKIRVRRLANGEWIAEVRGWFGWCAIARDFIRNGDVRQEVWQNDRRMTAMKDYTYAIRYAEAAKNDREEAVAWANQYAASRGKSASAVEIFS